MTTTDIATIVLLFWLGVGVALVVWARNEWERDVLTMAVVDLVIWPFEIGFEIGYQIYRFVRKHVL